MFLSFVLISKQQPLLMETKNKKSLGQLSSLIQELNTQIWKRQKPFRRKTRRVKSWTSRRKSAFPRRAKRKNSEESSGVATRPRDVRRLAQRGWVLLEVVNNKKSSKFSINNEQFGAIKAVRRRGTSTGPNTYNFLLFLFKFLSPPDLFVISNYLFRILKNQTV